MHYEKFADGTVKCIEDEIPFEIPDSWAWTRLGTICPYGDCVKVDTNNIRDDEWILDLEDIEKETGIILAHVTKKYRLAISTKHKFSKGQLLYSKLRPYLNKVVIADDDGYCTSEILPLVFWGDISPKYIQLFLMSNTFLAYVNKISYGVKMPRLGTTDGAYSIIAIPPLTEQNLISKKVQFCIDIISNLSVEKEQLLSIISSAKSRILDLAIRGKLIPQDPNDEPASVLLERIKAEKEELIKQGKIKRDKKESTIFKGEDNSYYEKIGNEVKCINAELPFEIPENWTWCRMSKLMYLVSGVTYNKNDVQKVGVRVLRGGNLTSTNEIKLCADDIFLPESYIDQQNQMQIGDIIIVASTGSTTVIGKPAFVESYYPKTQIGGFLKIIRPITVQAQQILWLLFRTKYYHESILDRVGGVNINNVKSAYLEDMLIPIPPKHELDLIIDEYSRLSQFVSYIEASLN